MWGDVGRLKVIMQGGSYRMVRVSGDHIQQERVQYEGRLSTFVTLEALVVVWSGRFRASLAKSTLSNPLGQLSSCALAPLEKAEGVELQPPPESSC